MANPNVFPLLSEVNAASIQYTDPKASMGGAGIPISYASINGEPVCAQSNQITAALLAPADPANEPERAAALAECMKCASSMHLQPNELRKYPKKTESDADLIFFKPTEKQRVFFRELDDHNRAQIERNAGTWFKTVKLPPAMLAQLYKPILQVDEETGEEVVRMKVSPSTKIRVQNPDARNRFSLGTINSITRNCYAIISFKLSGIYFQQQNCGASLYALQLVIFPSSSLSSNGTMNAADGVTMIMDDDFVPPTGGARRDPDADAAAASDTGHAQGAAFGGFENGASHVTEQTRVGMPTFSTVQNMASVAGMGMGPMF
jgi:hypothetical protein